MARTTEVVKLREAVIPWTRHRPLLEYCRDIMHASIMIMLTTASCLLRGLVTKLDQIARPILQHSAWELLLLPLKVSQNEGFLHHQTPVLMGQGEGDIVDGEAVLLD